MALFDQLMNRIEQCYKRLLAVSSSSSASSSLKNILPVNTGKHIHTHTVSASPPTQCSPSWGYLNGVSGFTNPISSNPTGIKLDFHFFP